MGRWLWTKQGLPRLSRLTCSCAHFPIQSHFSLAFFSCLPRRQIFAIDVFTSPPPTTMYFFPEMFICMQSNPKGGRGLNGVSRKRKDIATINVQLQLHEWRKILRHARANILRIHFGRCETWLTRNTNETTLMNALRRAKFVLKLVHVHGANVED